jgi:hypothetical protein
LGLAKQDKSPSLNGNGLGVYHCYCKSKYSLNFGSLSDSAATQISIQGGFLGRRLQDQNGVVPAKTEKEKTEELCGDYFNSQNIKFLSGNGVAVSISVINILLRAVGTKLINNIGYHYVDQQIAQIMTLIFVSQYINTGIVLIVSNANFANTPLSLIPVRNQFSDYSDDWYLEVGSTLEKTMMVASFMPFVSFTMAYFKNSAFKFLDSKFTMCREKPKTK